jgi:phage portal protein BeeE
MIGDLDRATFSNIEHQGIEFVTHTLLPILVAIEQAIKKSLLNGPGESNLSADFVVDGLMRGDQSSRYASYAVGRQWGWLSVNDIRQLENMNKISEGGDVYMQPMNMTDVSKPIPLPNEPKPGLKPLPAGEQKP